jgi:hypothetical protein
LAQRSTSARPELASAAVYVSEIAVVEYWFAASTEDDGAAESTLTVVVTETELPTLSTPVSV